MHQKLLEIEILEKGYRMYKTVDLTKMKKIRKNYKKNVYNVVNNVFHILIY